MEHCKICNEIAKKVFNAQILNKYNIDYFQCEKCDFVQTEKAYWLKEAYQNPMNYTDTGIMLRNDRSSKIVASLIFLFFNKKNVFLDYAGGYGVFTRTMRDFGFDYYWDDPYTKNVLSLGFESKPNMNFNMVTTFESFEHFDDPILEIEKILKLSKNIILSTTLITNPIPDPDKWWYYAKEHGQHIAFYSQKTFKYIAKKYNLNYYNIDNFHFFSERKLNWFSKQFLEFKFSKHILYGLSFVFGMFLNSNTKSDMENLIKQL
jgi:Methyltransferase domain